MMNYIEIDEKDKELIKAAKEVLQKNYTEPQHTVGAAVLCSSGKIYVGIDIESCGYGPCAEPIAIGAAFTNGERTIERIVAVGGASEPYKIIPPCGNCRQLIYNYAPECMVILSHKNSIVKVKVKELLPDAYSDFE
jgi:cytidine deaminase